MTLIPPTYGGIGPNTNTFASPHITYIAPSPFINQAYVGSPEYDIVLKSGEVLSGETRHFYWTQYTGSLTSCGLITLKSTAESSLDLARKYYKDNGFICVTEVTPIVSMGRVIPFCDIDRIESLNYKNAIESAFKLLSQQDPLKEDAQEKSESAFVTLCKKILSPLGYTLTRKD